MVIRVTEITATVSCTDHRPQPPTKFVRLTDPEQVADSEQVHRDPHMDENAKARLAKMLRKPQEHPGSAVSLELHSANNCAVQSALTPRSALDNRFRSMMHMENSDLCVGCRVTLRMRSYSPEL